MSIKGKPGRRTILTGAAGAALCGLAAPHIARAAQRMVRLGHNNTAASHYGQGAIAFANAVAANPVLAGQLIIEVHGNAELGDELGLLKNCAAGTVDTILCSATVVGNLVPQIGMVNAPFLFRDVAQARSVLDGPAGADLARLARAKDLNVLAWGKCGMRQFTSNKPIRAPQDLHGLKVREPQSDVMMDGMRALGASPAPLPFGLLREALRTGEFDAQENSIVNIETFKMAEFQKYLSLTNHIYDAALFFASSDLMDDLPEPQKAALAQCAQAGAVVMGQVVDASDRDGVARLKAAGMTVVADIDMAAFRASAQPYLQALGAKFGPDLASRLQSGPV